MAKLKNTINIKTPKGEIQNISLYTTKDELAGCKVQSASINIAGIKTPVYYPLLNIKDITDGDKPNLTNKRFKIDQDIYVALKEYKERLKSKWYIFRGVHDFKFRIPKGFSKATFTLYGGASGGLDISHDSTNLSSVLLSFSQIFKIRGGDTWVTYIDPTDNMEKIIATSGGNPHISENAITIGIGNIINYSPNYLNSALNNKTNHISCFFAPTVINDRNYYNNKYVGMYLYTAGLEIGTSFSGSASINCSPNRILKDIFAHADTDIFNNPNYEQFFTEDNYNNNYYDPSKDYIDLNRNGIKNFFQIYLDDTNNIFNSEADFGTYSLNKYDPDYATPPMELIVKSTKDADNIGLFDGGFPNTYKYQKYRFNIINDFQRRDHNIDSFKLLDTTTNDEYEKYFNDNKGRLDPLLNNYAKGSIVCGTEFPVQNIKYYYKFLFGVLANYVAKENYNQDTPAVTLKKPLIDFINSYMKNPSEFDDLLGNDTKTNTVGYHVVETMPVSEGQEFTITTGMSGVAIPVIGDKAYEDLTDFISQNITEKEPGKFANNINTIEAQQQIYNSATGCCIIELEADEAFKSDLVYLAKDKDNYSFFKLYKSDFISNVYKIQDYVNAHILDDRYYDLTNIKGAMQHIRFSDDAEDSNLCIAGYNAIHGSDIYKSVSVITTNICTDTTNQGSEALYQGSAEYQPMDSISLPIIFNHISNPTDELNFNNNKNDICISAQSFNDVNYNNCYITTINPMLNRIQSYYYPDGFLNRMILVEDSKYYNFNCKTYANERDYYITFNKPLNSLRFESKYTGFREKYYISLGVYACNLTEIKITNHEEFGFIKYCKNYTEVILDCGGLEFPKLTINNVNKITIKNGAVDQLYTNTAIVSGNVNKVNINDVMPMSSLTFLETNFSTKYDLTKSNDSRNIYLNLYDKNASFRDYVKNNTNLFIYERGLSVSQKIDAGIISSSHRQEFSIYDDTDDGIMHFRVDNNNNFFFIKYFSKAIVVLNNISDQIPSYHSEIDPIYIIIDNYLNKITKDQLQQIKEILSKSELLRKNVQVCLTVPNADILYSYDTLMNTFQNNIREYSQYILKCFTVPILLSDDIISWNSNIKPNYAEKKFIKDDTRYIFSNDEYWLKVYHENAYLSKYQPLIRMELEGNHYINNRVSIAKKDVIKLTENDSHYFDDTVIRVKGEYVYTGNSDTDIHEPTVVQSVVENYNDYTIDNNRSSELIYYGTHLFEYTILKAGLRSKKTKLCYRIKILIHNPNAPIHNPKPDVPLEFNFKRQTGDYFINNISNCNTLTRKEFDYYKNILDIPFTYDDLLASCKVANEGGISHANTTYCYPLLELSDILENPDKILQYINEFDYSNYPAYYQNFKVNEQLFDTISYELLPIYLAENDTLLYEQQMFSGAIGYLYKYNNKSKFLRDDLKNIYSDAKIINTLKYDSNFRSASVIDDQTFYNETINNPDIISHMEDAVNFVHHFDIDTKDYALRNLFTDTLMKNNGMYNWMNDLINMEYKRDPTNTSKDMFFDNIVQDFTENVYGSSDYDSSKKSLFYHYFKVNIPNNTYRINCFDRLEYIDLIGRINNANFNESLGNGICLTWVFDPIMRRISYNNAFKLSGMYQDGDVKSHDYMSFFVYYDEYTSEEVLVAAYSNIVSIFDSKIDFVEVYRQKITLEEISKEFGFTNTVTADQLNSMTDSVLNPIRIKMPQKLTINNYGKFLINTNMDLSVPGYISAFDYETNMVHLAQVIRASICNIIFNNYDVIKIK